MLNLSIRIESVHNNIYPEEGAQDEVNPIGAIFSDAPSAPPSAKG
jgi:hypothetical protein